MDPADAAGSKDLDAGQRAHGERPGHRGGTVGLLRDRDPQIA